MSKNKNASAAKNNNASKAAPKPPTLRAVGPAVDKNKPKDKEETVVLEDEEEGDEDEGSDAKSHKVNYIARVSKLSKRVQLFVSQAQSNARLHNAAANVLGSLKALIEEAEKLPEDWKRSKTARPGKAFGPGDIVAIAEGHRARYADLIEKDEMDDLRVIKQINKKVSVKCPGGDKMFVPAHHLAKKAG